MVQYCEIKKKKIVYHHISTRWDGWGSLISNKASPMDPNFKEKYNPQHCRNLKNSYAFESTFERWMSLIHAKIFKGILV